MTGNIRAICGKILPVLAAVLLFVLPAGQALCDSLSRVPDGVILPPEEKLIQQSVPDYVPQLLEIAAGELGYTEGPDNESKYGAWAGDPHAAWCAEFVCWCVNECDTRCGTELSNTVYPRWSGQNTGKDWLIKRGRFVYRKGFCKGWGYQWCPDDDHYLTKGEFIPSAGDLLFFSYNEAGDTEHVALIEFVTRTSDDVILHVIEGNNPDRVQRAAYRMSNSQVLGYGITRDLIRTAMRPGCEGDKVLEMQQMLCDLGYLDVSQLSGSYLGSTQNAVAAFQKAQMPERTHYGIADRETVEVLLRLWTQAQWDAPNNWLVDE